MTNPEGFCGNGKGKSVKQRRNEDKVEGTKKKGTRDANRQLMEVRLRREKETKEREDQC